MNVPFTIPFDFSARRSPCGQPRRLRTVAPPVAVEGRHAL